MTVHYKVYVSPTHINVMIPDGDLLYVNDRSCTYGMLERYQLNRISTDNTWYFYDYCSRNSDYTDGFPSVNIYAFNTQKRTRSSAGGAL